MLGGEVAVQKRQQLHQLLRKIVARQLLAAIALKRGSIEWSATGSTAHSEIDSPRVQGVKHAKGFGDLQWAVVRQHHAPRSDPDSGGLGGDPGHKNFGRGTGQSSDS